MSVTSITLDNGVPPIYFDDTCRITHNPSEAYPGLHDPPRAKPGLSESASPVSLRLDLGAGEISRPGFTPIDRLKGQEVFPLPYKDGEAEEIVASHILEHYPYRQVEKVLQEWVRVLKPGGRIRLAVPDFDYIAKGYLAGRKEPFGPYLMGGQTDANDFHRSIFDEEHLTALMQDAGLDRIQRWKSEIEDCASLPCSLNLEGCKRSKCPIRPLPKIQAIMSMPRLAFSDNMFCAIEVVAQLGIPFERVTGVYWGQCLERCMEQYLHNGTEWILTVDYDSVFRAEDIRRLCALVQDYPEIDALAPIQVKREDDSFLMGVLQPDGSPYPPGTAIDLSHFAGDLTRASWAHFGCTLIRTAALKTIRKPWFKSEPDPNGSWHEGRQDDDTYFWREWLLQGKTLYLANRVPIGHDFLMIAWPSIDAGIIYQRPTEFSHGKTAQGIWR